MTAPMAATAMSPRTVVGGKALPLAVGAVILLLPFGDYSVPVIGLRLSYVAMAVPAALAVRAIVAGRRLPASLILLGAGLGMVGGVVSAAAGVAPDRSVPLVVISAITLGFATAVVFAYRPGLEVGALDLLVVVGGVVAGTALASAGSIQAAEAGSVVNGRLTGPFSQPNELGVFCAALLPIAVACLVSTASWRRGVLLGIATGCLAAACVMSMSRGSWIGGTAALICLAVCEPATRRALGAVGLVLLGTCLAALMVPADVPILGVLGSRIRSLGDPAGNQYDDRPLIWAEALRQGAEHPWLGVGPGAFQNAASTSASAVSADPADHAHNLVLTTLADRGVIGVALGVLVVTGVVVAARRQLLAVPRPGTGDHVFRVRSMAVVAALTAVVVHGSFDMPLRNPIVAALVWTLLGLAMVAETTGPPAPRREPVDRPRVRPSSDSKVVQRW
ncbi:O-antigen ligase family protein [Nocardioides stalactiti]|uniref:O-antigen ligase family protein n=1 Tax=Nocardioides stalactiti TaxID=2755356 RepID=UPI0016018FD3|nr:O-antigen ligase family protein [Nocardioides stalactiti]